MIENKADFAERYQRGQEIKRRFLKMVRWHGNVVKMDRKQQKSSSKKVH